MKLWIFLLLSICSTANAQWSIRPQAGLGFTDNANFEDSERDADFFYWLRSSNTYIQPASRWNIWLNARGYFKENQNDALSYRLGRSTDERTRSLGIFEWDVAFGGMQYFRSSPGTTEESFSNVYGETSLLKTWSLQNDLEFSFEPGYQLRYYPSFSGRTDHTALVALGADWNFGLIHSLNPFSEFGFVFSNQSLYSKYYLEFGTDWTIFPRPDLKYIFHFLSKYSAFPNREVSETTAVSNRKGQIKTQTQNEIETQSFVQIQGSVVKMLGSSELKTSLGLNSQSTRSGIEDYQEFEGWVSITTPF